MSTEFDNDLFGNRGGETTRRCGVVAVYEDHGSRDLLLQLSDALARKFKNDVEFQFDWCRFKYLADPEIARQAAQSATQADLILLAPKSPDLPVYVQGWLEGWRRIGKLPTERWCWCILRRKGPHDHFRCKLICA